MRTLTLLLVLTVGAMGQTYEPLHVRAFSWRDTGGVAKALVIPDEPDWSSSRVQSQFAVLVAAWDAYAKECKAKRVGVGRPVWVREYSYPYIHAGSTIGIVSGYADADSSATWIQVNGVNRLIYVQSWRRFPGAKKSYEKYTNVQPTFPGFIEWLRRNH